MLLPKNKDGCPYLLLAPMEGVGDRCFRRAMASVGGFDEAVTEFMRVPSNAHVKSLARDYQFYETLPIPLAAQLMGSDPGLMADMAHEIEKLNAPRIDLNCGCPSNTVTGRGAGSSLLKDPNLLHSIASAMVKAVNVPVTVKMRTGFDDTSLFRENLKAAEESGARYISLHARTKAEGYTPPAKWEYIAEAKTIVDIPIVGNGDILNVNDALRMLSETGCDALMIGRGSVINPFIFHEIKAHFSGIPYKKNFTQLQKYLETYLAEIPPLMPIKGQINKMKQLMGFLFKGNEALISKRQEILTSQAPSVKEFMDAATPLLQALF